MRDTKIDKRNNATKYIQGRKPSTKSEYFGKSYAQLQRESTKSKALDKMKTSDATPPGRSQKYFRESKGILEGSSSAWPKPRHMK